MLFKYTSIAVAVASFASAMSTDISPECVDAFTTVATNSDAVTCLNLQGFLTVGTTPEGQSVVKNIDSWVGGVCAAAPCKPETLTFIGDTIGKGCVVELGPVLGGSNFTLTDFINKYYATVRKVLCLKDKAANGEFCATEFLYAVETSTGVPLTLQGLDTIDVTKLPKEVVCSTCSQATYAIVKADLPELFTDPTFEEGVKQYCGDAFVNGGVPPTIGSRRAIVRSRY